MWDLAGEGPAGEAGKYAAPAMSAAMGAGNAISTLGQSALAKIGIGNASPQLADAVGKMYADRYGSPDKALNTLRDNPAEMLMDIASVGYVRTKGTLPQHGAAGPIPTRA